MDFNKIPLFTAMSRRMAWLGQRQELLAQNVANADTPGYVAKDLKPQTFGDVLRESGAGLQMKASAGTSLGVSSGKARVEQTGSEDKLLSGNSVTLEDEMMKTAQTAMDYQLTTNLYRKHIAMIKTALGRGGI